MTTDADFLLAHALPGQYLKTAQRWFNPLADRIADRVNRKHSDFAPIIGINGSQGSGKTTLADYLVHRLAQHHKIEAVAVSIDDFYLTRDEREQLSHTVHPLLRTRGVPGTHDVALAINTLNALKGLTQLTEQVELSKIQIPRFDKSQDDRKSRDEWTSVDRRPAVIFFEGWCVGSQAQADSALDTPCNTLESIEDKDGRWRHYINAKLQNEYTELFAMIDHLIMLKAPSFDCVYDWRLEQEQKLRDRHAKATHLDTPTSNSAIMNDEEVQRFVQHYERITRHNLAHLQHMANDCFVLNNHREIIEHIENTDTRIGSIHRQHQSDTSC